MTDFVRPPRLRETAEPVEVALPTPPTPPRRYRRSSLGQVLLIALLPSLLPPVVLATVTYYAGAATATVITSAALGASLGLAVVVTTLLSRRDESARIRAEDDDYAAQRAAFEATLASIGVRSDGLLAREARILAREFPPPSTLMGRVAALEPSTWERRPADSDFLELRLGLGRRRSCLRFRDESSGSAEPLIAQLQQRVGYHAAAPITATFRPGTLVGTFGRRDTVDGLLMALALQVAAQHAPGEVGLAVLSRDESLCSWAKWLPHARTLGSRQQIPLVARVGAEANEVLRALSNDLLGRAGAPGGRVYVVIADERGWDSLPRRIERYLPAGTLGFVLLRVQDAYEALRGDCDFVLDLSGTGGRLARRVEPGEPPVFEPDGVKSTDAMHAALAIAPLVVAEAPGTGVIPASARLADLLGNGAGDERTIIDTWDAARLAFRLAAPIGVGPGEMPVDLDLRRDGPHGLIAGTTGSGKSELLQSLVVALAARVPPDLLNFLLFDYKGGAAFADVERLPHVVGMVTDLDERRASRALTSLRAELRRRARLFSDEGVANIIDYQSRRRTVPLANLVIIIDEFHRLVSEQPAFIDQMVQIATQGRSYGVHLLLSTQKPSGVVTDQIRANVALRICLRVTDESDSRDVLGGPEAAAIPRNLPGRMYIRSGNEPLRVCQAGRVSGQVPARRGGVAEIEAEVFLPPLRPKTARANGLLARAVPTARSRPPDEERDETDLVDERKLLVDAISEAAERARYPQQAAPWEEPLPDPATQPLLLASLERWPATDPGALAIGLLDEPESQRQRPFQVRLEDGHIAIGGAANTGKSTGLLTIAAAAARVFTPQQLHIYGIDFAGGGLEPLGALPHCGGVAAQTDPARVRWVLQALRDSMDERLAVGSSRRDWPRMLVLVDNFPALHQSLQNASDGGQDAADELFEILDVGRSAGITFAITAERPDAIRPNVLALLHSRLALPLANSEGYSTLGLQRVSETAEPIPGRALVPGHVSHEVQIAIDPRFEAWDGIPPSAAVGGPMPIAPLPAAVEYQAALGRATAAGRSGSLVLGLQDGTKPLFTRPASDHLLVLGPRGSGRSTALSVALAELRRLGVREVVAANPRRSLELKSAAATTFYGELGEQLTDVWERVATLWRERSAAFAAGAETSLAPCAIVIDDADAIEFPYEAEKALEQLILRGADLGVQVVVAADTRALRASYPSGVTKAMLNLRQGLLLSPETFEDFEFFGVRGRPARGGPGRGWWCEGGGKHAVQIAASP